MHGPRSIHVNLGLTKFCSEQITKLLSSRQTPLLRVKSKTIYLGNVGYYAALESVLRRIGRQESPKEKIHFLIFREYFEITNQPFESIALKAEF